MTACCVRWLFTPVSWGNQGRQAGAAGSLLLALQADLGGVKEVGEGVALHLGVLCHLLRPILQQAEAPGGSKRPSRGASCEAGQSAVRWRTNERRWRPMLPAAAAVCLLRCWNYSPAAVAGCGSLLG
jgi:hypothetical protein